MTIGRSKDCRLHEHAARRLEAYLDLSDSVRYWEEKTYKATTRGSPARNWEEWGEAAWRSRVQVPQPGKIYEEQPSELRHLHYNDVLWKCFSLRVEPHIETVDNKLSIQLTDSLRHCSNSVPFLLQHGIPLLILSWFPRVRC